MNQLQKNVKNVRILYDRFSLSAADKPQSSLVLNRLVSCSQSWPYNSLPKTPAHLWKANTFVKVDAQIEEDYRQTIIYLKQYS